MPTARSILADLKTKGSEKVQVTYARHGMPAHRTLGVTAADMKLIAKSIRGQQALACELYETGWMEAMYLAGLVVNGSQMTRAQLTGWAEAAKGLSMISEYTVPWAAVENPHARDLAIEWIESGEEYVACAGWSTYSGLLATLPDDALDLNQIDQLVHTVVKEIHGGPNRVRYNMNGFVIAVGTYVRPLSKQAYAAARKIGAVSVDMGDTACEVRRATEAIEKVEAAGKVGRKRKTIRC